MFSFLFARPIATLLTVAGVAVLAPVIFPIIGFILKPIVGPATALYLELTDEMAEAIKERDKLQKSQKATAETTGLLVAEEKAAQQLTKKEKAVQEKAARAIIKGMAEII
ncbi:MAG: hypothetical protein ACLPT6_10885 [Desulfobaccales bacterium]